MRAPQSALCVVVGCAATLAACGDADEHSVTPATVTRSERVWVDGSRPTPRTAAYAGAPDRALRVLIWQPTLPGVLPLVVMAHGFGGLPEKFDAFARVVAAAGVVVAAPAFPLTNERAPGGHDAGLRDFINQPADVSFVLTQLLQANVTFGDEYYGRIAPTNVAVLGHSLGGVTTLALTRKACCRDGRVRASVLVAPVPLLLDAFGADAPDATGLPTLIMHGTADPTVPFASSTMLYDMLAPPRFLLGITGAGHSEALESQSTPPIPARSAAQRASVAFLGAVFHGADAELEATFAALAAAGDVVRSD